MLCLIGVSLYSMSPSSGVSESAIYTVGGIKESLLTYFETELQRKIARVLLSLNFSDYPDRSPYLSEKEERPASWGHLTDLTRQKT